MIDVKLIGTSGMIPLPDRFLSSCLISYNGSSILIDCGEATQIALKKAKISLSKIDAILITHLHGDHVLGLPGLLSSIGNAGRQKPINIYGPIGIYKALEGLLYTVGYIPYELMVIEMEENIEHKFDIIGLDVHAISLEHWISCFGYSFILNLKSRFLPDKAKELNVPVSMWQKLHNGESVKIGGKIIVPEMVLGEKREPLKISYCTDTRPIDNIINFAMDSNLFICEGMYGNEDKKEDAVSKKHMTFSEAASLAQKANVKRLWLTHFSPSMPNPEEYINIAQNIFENTEIGSDFLSTVIK